MSPKFSDYRLPLRVPVSMPVNHGEAGPPCCSSGPLANPDMALGPTWCRDLGSVCSASQVPACTSLSSASWQQLGRPQPQQGFLTGPKPRPPPGLNIKEISQFSFFALKQGLLHMQTRDSLWGTLSTTCFHIASFVPASLKAVSQTSVIVSLYRWHQARSTGS